MFVDVKFSEQELLEVAPSNETTSQTESQSLDCIRKIEMQVATLAMEKALKFVLEYNKGKQRNQSTPISGKGWKYSGDGKKFPVDSLN